MGVYATKGLLFGYPDSRTSVEWAGFPPSQRKPPERGWQLNLVGLVGGHALHGFGKTRLAMYWVIASRLVVLWL